jgi:hypothetical protein
VRVLLGLNPLFCSNFFLFALIHLGPDAAIQNQLINTELNDSHWIPPAMDEMV